MMMKMRTVSRKEMLVTIKAPHPKLTLPEGEENNCFNWAEFQDWVVGFEKLLRCVVEQKQSVKSQRNREVVDHSDVKISGLRADEGYVSERPEEEDEE